jgi:hypothetical protein
MEFSEYLSREQIELSAKIKPFVRIGDIVRIVAGYSADRISSFAYDSNYVITTERGYVFRGISLLRQMPFTEDGRFLRRGKEERFPDILRILQFQPSQTSDIPTALAGHVIGTSDGFILLPPTEEPIVGVSQSWCRYRALTRSGFVWSKLGERGWKRRLRNVAKISGSSSLFKDGTISAGQMNDHIITDAIDLFQSDFAALVVCEGEKIFISCGGKWVPLLGVNTC